MESTSELLDQSANFLSALKNLQGTTYGEKQKHFFTLLKSLSIIDPTMKREIAAAIMPDSHLEKVFYIETLISFKLSEELFEYLATNIDGTTRKIFRQKWLFQNPFEDMSVPIIVDEFLPKFSIINRNRILSRLGKYHRDEKKIDELFDALLKKYGLYLAQFVLCGCSVNKMEFALNNCTIQLNQRQLLSLFDKNHDVFMATVKTSPSYCANRQIKKLYRYLLRVDLMFCFETCKNNYTKFGKRGTQKFLAVYKSEVLHTPGNYLNNDLHRPTLRKSLTIADLSVALENIFPKRIESFKFYQISLVLGLIPLKDRYTLFSETYKKVYNRPLSDNVQHMDEDLVEIIGDTEEREKWIEYKLKEGVTATRYMHCYELSKAMKMIRSKMNFTSTYKVRETLMEKMVEACVYNFDQNREEAMKALLEALKYVCKRHRNDDTIDSFARSLRYSLDLSQLSQEHWKYIHEILEIIKVKQRFFNFSEFQTKYIEFLWRNKLPIEDNLVMELLDAISTCKYNMKECSKSFQKTLLPLLLAKRPLKTIKDEDERVRKDTDLFLWLFDWNRQNYNHPIDAHNYPTLIESIKIYLNKENCDDSLEVMFKAQNMCKKDPTDFEKYLEDIYFTKFVHKYSKSGRQVILWFLKNRPSSLVKYSNELAKFVCNKTHEVKRHYFTSQKVIAQMKKYNNPIMSYINKLHEYGFSQQITDFVRENYENQSTDLGCALMFGAYLMKPEEYLEVFKKYVPCPNRMEVDADKRDSSIILENAVIKSLIYCQSPTVLPSVIQSCFDQYLNIASNTFHYYFYHYPVNVLRESINELFKHPEIGKVLMFSLTNKYDTVDNVINVYQSLNANGDQMIQKRLLRKALIYLRRNPSDAFFSLISERIKDLKVSERRVLKILEKLEHISVYHKVKLLDIVFDNVDCQDKESLLPVLAETVMKEFDSLTNKIPVEFRINFLNFIINHFKSHTNPSCSVKDVVSQFLTKIGDGFFIGLPHDICTLFIQTYVFEGKTFLAKENFDRFAIRYIFSSTDNFSVGCDALFQKVSSMQQASSRSLAARMSCKQEIARLMSLLCLEISSRNSDIIQTFHDKLSQICPVSEYVDIFYYLRILIIKKETNDIRVTSSKLYNLLAEMRSAFGPVVTLFASIVRTAFGGKENSDETMYSLCQSLLENNDTTLNYLFIISLLPRSSPVNKVEQDKFNMLLSSVGCHADPIVKVQFSIFMKQYH